MTKDGDDRVSGGGDYPKLFSDWLNSPMDSIQRFTISNSSSYTHEGQTPVPIKYGNGTIVGYQHLYGLGILGFGIGHVQINGYSRLPGAPKLPGER